MNHDGNIDLVTSLGAGIGVFLGNGDLTFQPAIASSTRPTRLTLADMNVDGHLDVAMLVFPEGSFGTQKLGVALGNGDGTFKPAAIYFGSSTLDAGSPITGDVDAADMNRDGYPDLVFTNYASNDLSFFLNNGDGTLSNHERYGAGRQAALSAVADFTGDRLPDVATLIKLPPGGFSNAIVMIRGLRNPGGVPFPGSSEIRLRHDLQNPFPESPKSSRRDVHVLPIGHGVTATPSGMASRPMVTSGFVVIATAETPELTGRDSLAPAYDDAPSPRRLGRNTRPLMARSVTPDWTDSLFVESLFAV